MTHVFPLAEKHTFFTRIKNTKLNWYSNAKCCLEQLKLSIEGIRVRATVHESAMTPVLREAFVSFFLCWKHRRTPRSISRVSQYANTFLSLSDDIHKFCLAWLADFHAIAPIPESVTLFSKVFCVFRTRVTLTLFDLTPPPPPTHTHSRYHDSHMWHDCDTIYERVL